MKRMIQIVVALVVAIAGATNQVQAEIIGSSNLLDAASLSQLEGWLGEGPLDITMIFQSTGSTYDPAAFHAAADGAGRTFSIIGTNLGGQIIGGYNPQSWDSSYQYHAGTPNEAFIFNLTTDLKYSHTGGDGYLFNYETYNNPNYGPTFGGGHDLWVQPNGTSNSYTYAYSYGGVSLGGTNILGNSRITSFGITGMEIFTIAPASPVPEPSTYAGLLGITCVSLLAYGWRRKRGQAA